MVSQTSTRTVTACIDGSGMSGSVCDAAAWASQRIDSPLKFLHVVEKPAGATQDDLSGALRPGGLENLLNELTELDERRGRLAIEYGKHMLDEAKRRATEKGAEHVSVLQRHGELLDTLKEYEQSTRLFVIGRLGVDHYGESQAIGSHVESVVRAIHTSILVAVGEFIAPQRFMIAYDGSDTADKTIADIAGSPLLKSMPGHVVMVANETEENRATLQRACVPLTESGLKVDSHLVQGPVVQSLAAFREAHDVSLTVMGAYGHSRIREFFVGSNTSKMISTSKVPLLLLR